MVRERAQAFVMQGDSVLFNYRGQIAEMALRNRLPAASIQRELAEAGFLLTYGADIRDLYRRSAGFVDKIFKGAKPADLPVEQPTKFELVINLKTAKALGIIVPLLRPARADEVIDSGWPTARTCGLRCAMSAIGWIVLQKSKIEQPQKSRKS